jgi:hypothetical protein
MLEYYSLAHSTSLFGTELATCADFEREYQIILALCLYGISLVNSIR